MNCASWHPINSEGKKGCTESIGTPLFFISMAMRKYFNPRVIKTVIGILFVLLAWVVCIPAQFGGNLNYVVITGNSMEPFFHSGDFVVTDKSRNFTIGDIVIYNNPDVGKIIHRIIGRDGQRFILQGDNNSWVDSYQPTRGEILGKYWFSIPKAGTIFLQLQKPWIFALLSGSSILIVGVSMIKTPQQRKKNKMKNSRFLHNFGIQLSHWKDGYWYPVYLVGLGCLVLGIFSFVKPVEISTAKEITYTQNGNFAYSGNASQFIYDANTVESGDPIFTSLACQVNVAFDYEISAIQKLAGAGEYQLNTALTSQNGWYHTVDQSSLTKFDGNTFHVEQPINLCELQDYVKFVNSITGVKGQMYTLEIRPLVNYSGVIDGSLLKTQFTPILKLRMDEQQVFMADENNADEGDPLKPSEEGAVSIDQTVPNVMNILGIKLPVQTGRVISAAGLLLAVVGLIIPSLSMKQAEKNDAKLRDRMLFGNMLVEVQQPPLGKKDQAVDLSSLEDLLLLAEKTGLVVKALYTPAENEYYVQCDNLYYRYRKPVSPSVEE